MSRAGRARNPGMRSVLRSVRYLTKYGRQAAMPYLFLVIATLAQLAVP